METVISSTWGDDLTDIERETLIARRSSIDKAMELIAPTHEETDECRYYVEGAILALDFDDEDGRLIDGPLIKAVKRKVKTFRDALVVARDAARELPLESRLLKYPDWWPEEPDWKRFYETVDVLIEKCETVVGTKDKAKRPETRKRRAVREALFLYAYGKLHEDELHAGRQVEDLAAVLLDDPNADLYRDRHQIQKQHPHFWPFPQRRTDAPD